VGEVRPERRCTPPSNAFMQSPAKLGDAFGDGLRLRRGGAQPGAQRLAALEEMGIVRAVITQNVDGLHQAGGSRRWIAVPRNMEELICVYCWKRYPTRER